jgi:hypothetical protein
MLCFSITENHLPLPQQRAGCLLVYILQACKIAIRNSFYYGKICHGTQLFSSFCLKTPLHCGFSEYHYNFVACLPEHTTLPKMETLSFLCQITTLHFANISRTFFFPHTKGTNQAEITRNLKIEQQLVSAVSHIHTGYELEITHT